MHQGLIPSYVKKMGFKNIFPKGSATRNTVAIITKGIGDLVPLTPIGAKYYLDQLNLPIDTLVQTPVMLFENDLYIAFSLMTSDTIVKKWQTALETVKKSERYTQIRRKYLGSY